MKKTLKSMAWIGTMTFGLILLTSFGSSLSEVKEDYSNLNFPNDKLRREVFMILDTKCNVCHRKKNPFMVFNQKNMTKRAQKIHNAVFVERIMPKGNKVRLTNDEYAKLEKWLFTQNIY